MSKITIPKVTLAAEWDADDPEVERIWHFMKTVIRCLDIDEATEDEADFKADRVLEKLHTARNHYQKIKQPSFKDLTSSQQQDEYNELYGALWAAYKDRLQALLKEVGYDIGFMFQSPKEFEKNAAQFVEDHPGQSWLVDYARDIRDKWQNDFGNTRNFTEHSGDLRSLNTDYNDPETAKELFEVVCYVIEGVFALLSQEKLQRGWLVVIVNDDETVFGRGERFALKHAAQLPIDPEPASS